MKNTLKIFSLILIISILATVVGCGIFNKNNHNTSSDSGISSDKQISSNIVSTESDLGSDETLSGRENSSSENQDLSSNSSNMTTNTSSNTSSTTSNPSSNTSSTNSNPSTNTSSTSSSSTSSIMSWKEQKEAAGITVLYDENVKLYYYELYNGDYEYEAKFDGINWTRGKSYFNWDSTLKMYYKIEEGYEMSYYDRKNGKRIDHINNHFWNDKYYNGYWKIDFKWYTDDTQIFLKDYEYEEDTSVPTCKHCGKVLGNGTNGTCMDLCCQTLLSDEKLKKWQCVSCNTIVSGGCHTCPDGTVYNPIDGWEYVIILTE